MGEAFCRFSIGGLYPRGQSRPCRANGEHAALMRVNIGQITEIVAAPNGIESR